jgi:hypothetical protein
MNKYAIVVIAYNRTESLLRLLDSLNRAEYDGDQIPLIISIDDSGEDAVKNAAESFAWNHGEKQIRTFPEKQGLRRHVLQCGDYLHEYDAVAVFEDDLYAAPGFYQYMKETVSFYQDEEQIAGISLYSRGWNVLTDRIFEPMRMDSDVFYMQFAQSWGQIWMKHQWFAFLEWYNSLSEKDCKTLWELPAIPTEVKQWPESSWLKFHIAYCILKQKYFVYPYDSLTTNYSDQGEHSKKTSWRYQVPMQMAVKKEYRLQPLCKESVRYDGFFESMNLAPMLGVEEEDLCVDLYGSKPGNMGKPYWLTANNQPSLVPERTYGLQLRPLEANIRCQVAGDDFKLYKVGETEITAKTMKKNMADIDYDIRGEGLALKNVVSWILYKTKMK